MVKIAILFSMTFICCTSAERLDLSPIFIPGNDTIVIRSPVNDYIAPYIVRLVEDDLFISSRRSTKIYKYSITSDSILDIITFPENGPGAVGLLATYAVNKNDLIIFSNGRRRAVIWDQVDSKFTERELDISSITDCRITSLDAMRYSNIPIWSSKLFFTIECDGNYKNSAELSRIHRVASIDLSSSEVSFFGLYPDIYQRKQVPINAIISTSHLIVGDSLMVHFPYSRQIAIYNLLKDSTSFVEMSSLKIAEPEPYMKGNDPKDEYEYFEQHGYYVNLWFDPAQDLYLRLVQFRSDPTEPIAVGRDNIDMRRYKLLTSKRDFTEVKEFDINYLNEVRPDCHFYWNEMHYFMKKDSPEGLIEFIAYSLNKNIYKDE